MNRLNLWWSHFQGNALFSYYRLLSLTVRWRLEGTEHIEEARASGRPVLWSLWHGQAMQFMLYAYSFEDPRDFVAVVVGDARFDILSTLGARLHAGGAYAVDMQGNPVAAGRAVLRVIQAMKGGKQSVIAPDGPDGPPFVPKEGVGFLARKAAAAILPVGFWTRHGFYLNRWDRYLVPLPFARLHAVFGRPILVEAEMDSAALLAKVAEALHQVRTRAQVLAGVRPWR
jgi:lysophospholipid acyltransferase (LPLAT)-like uncharacterized protein